MGKTHGEREEDKRQERLQKMHAQISSGALVVRQMTATERRLWDERAASFDKHSDPGERDRREAARQRRRDKAAREQQRRDALPPR
jgi:hypothetical protein